MQINLGKDHFIATLIASAFNHAELKQDINYSAWVIKAKDINEARIKAYKLLERFYPNHSYRVVINPGNPYIDDPVDENIILEKA